MGFQVRRLAVNFAATRNVAAVNVPFPQVGAGWGDGLGAAAGDAVDAAVGATVGIVVWHPSNNIANTLVAAADTVAHLAGGPPTRRTLTSSILPRSSSIM